MSADSVDVPSLGDRIRYQIDRFLSWSPMARFVGLFGLSFLMVVLCGTLALIIWPRDPEKPFDLLDAMWWALGRLADAGNMADDEGTLVRAVAVITTLSGVAVVALLIGLVSSTVGDKLDDLRKGHSPVIDSNHTLILGFGEKAFAILREIREANSNQKDLSIVILSPSDKEEVENAVRERLPDMGTTRVVVRQGSPYSPHDLRKVGAGRARSIIVLASDVERDSSDDSGNADMSAIKTLLALRRIPGALTRNHVTIELLDAGRRGVVERLGGGGVEVVAMREVLSRMMVQTARQAGLAQVYRDLLTFEGSELYFKAFPELTGQPFGVVQWRMKDAVVVGVRRPKPDGAASCILNPPEDLKLESGDEMIVIAEDDDSFDLTSPRTPQVPAAFSPPPPQPQRPERLLICGMASKLGDVLREFDNYLMDGSEAWLMPGRTKDEIADFLDENAPDLKHIKLRYVDGDPTQPEALKKLTAGEFSVALVISDDSVDAEEADAKTVITVLLLRELFQPLGEKKPRIISEILDPRTKDLVENDYGADFVVSSEITSMLLAQVSERRDVNAVFADLFDSDGNELYLKRACLYAPVGAGTSWLAVQKVARSRGEVAIGYLRPGQNPVINPPQEPTLVLADGDRIIVVSEDGREEPMAVQASA